MDIILLDNVQNLGDKNDLVTVKPGYANNYLIPKGFAVVANKGNLKMRDEKKRQDDLRKQKEMEELQKIANSLHDTVITVGAKVGTTGKIFGSVTTHHLAEEIKKQTGHKVDRKKLSLNEDVKSLGHYTAHLDLHDDLKVDVQFEVVSE